MRRGELWWVDFPEPVGSETGYYRPAIIVQDLNIPAIVFGTVLVVPLTSTLRLASQRTCIRLDRGDTGLRHDSCAVVPHLVSIASIRVEEFIGTLSDNLMAEIDVAMMMVLGLIP